MFKSIQWQNIYRRLFPRIFSKSGNRKSKLKEEEQLRHLLNINRNIIYQQDFSHLLQYIVRKGMKLLRVDAAILRLIDEEGKFLLPKAVAGKSSCLNHSPVPLGKDSITKKGGPKAAFLFYPDISKKSLYALNDLEKEKFTSLLSVPLKVKNSVLGILSVYSKNKREFTPFEMKIAQILASQATLCIVKNSYIKKMEKEATMDKMTGLYNQNCFYQRLEEEVARTSRNGCSLSLLFMDTDRLKDINDTYGHLAGDKVLQFFARKIKESIRKMDIAFRYGGDEFAVILPEADSEKAFLIAERIRQKVKEVTSLHSVSLSFGIASFPRDSKRPQELLNKADQAMYQAKRKGGNRIEKINDHLPAGHGNHNSD